MVSHKTTQNQDQSYTDAVPLLILTKSISSHPMCTESKDKMAKSYLNNTCKDYDIVHPDVFSISKK